MKAMSCQSVVSQPVCLLLCYVGTPTRGRALFDLGVYLEDGTLLSHEDTARQLAADTVSYRYRKRITYQLANSKQALNNMGFLNNYMTPSQTPSVSRRWVL